MLNTLIGLIALISFGLSAVFGWVTGATFAHEKGHKTCLYIFLFFMMIFCICSIYLTHFSTN